MNNETKALLAATGVVAISGLVYLVNKPSIPGNCKQVVASCDFLDGEKYHRKAIASLACATDAGDVEVVVQEGNPSPPDINACVFSVFDGGTFPQTVPFACAWAPNGGDCDALSDGVDGGVVHMKAGAWTMQPGKFVGADCVLRPCTEVFGVPWTP